MKLIFNKDNPSSNKSSMPNDTNGASSSSSGDGPTMTSDEPPTAYSSGHDATESNNKADEGQPAKDFGDISMSSFDEFIDIPSVTDLPKGKSQSLNSNLPTTQLF